VQYIFQDRWARSPRMTVSNLREPLVIHESATADYQAELVKEADAVVGPRPRFLSRYPHSFSGAAQRIGIARARPQARHAAVRRAGVCARRLDPGQVLNLLQDLKAELGLTYLFISHNLAVVDYIADEIAVMCKGRIVEIAPREDPVPQPGASYTRGCGRRARIPTSGGGSTRRGDGRRPRDPAEWRAPFVWTRTCRRDARPRRGHRVRASSGADFGRAPRDRGTALAAGLAIAGWLALAAVPATAALDEPRCLPGGEGRQAPADGRAPARQRRWSCRSTARRVCRAGTAATCAC